MKIKFYNPKSLIKTFRVAIHKTGKIGFTVDAANSLKLGEQKSADIGHNEEDSNDKNLYMVLHKDNEGAFKISKAGAYYYINVKVLFDALKIPYAKENVVYDMEQREEDGLTFYSLKRKEAASKSEDEKIN